MPSYNQNPSPNSRPKAPSLDYLNGVRAKFHLPAEPEGVKKIVDLVKGKDSSSMQEIVRIIDTDHMVSQRLIKMAYPKAAARQGATVQMATSRLGVNRVIVVMVGELLSQAVIETFETMVSMTLDVEDPSMVSSSDQMFLTGTVRFSGKTNGQVTLAFSPHLSLLIAARSLGGTMDDTYPPEVMNDVIGEIVNIVTGNLQSRLCDAGFESEVGLPEVKYHSGLPKGTVAGGSNDQFYFRHGMYSLAVNLSIDPH
jgi:CheY-specific phosphatase CheX